jgi:hypothetical protein
MLYSTREGSADLLHVLVDLCKIGWRRNAGYDHAVMFFSGVFG